MVLFTFFLQLLKKTSDWVGIGPNYSAAPFNSKSSWNSIISADVSTQAGSRVPESGAAGRTLRKVAWVSVNKFMQSKKYTFKLRFY